jgi:hypothetical protein
MRRQALSARKEITQRCLNDLAKAITVGSRTRVAAQFLKMIFGIFQNKMTSGNRIR